MAGILTMLDKAQGGRLYSHVAETLDLDEGETRNAMDRLCPAIATRLKAKAEEDDDLFESLLDLIEDGQGASPLEEPEALTDADALSDGHNILEDVYGSRNDAMVELRKVAPDVPERELSKLAPISATAVVAALAQANQAAQHQPMGLTGAEPAAAQDGGGTSGVLGTLIGAVIAGAVSGVVKELTSAKRWRGTTSYTQTRTKRRTTRTTSHSRSQQRSRTTGRSGGTGGSGGPSINDIFRDILGNLGK